MLKKHSHQLLLLVGVLGIFILLSPFWLSATAKLLVKQKPTTQADIIVVLGGGSGKRIAFASTLYHDGVAPTLLMSGGGKESGFDLAGLMSKYAQKSGVPSTNILSESKSLSTYGNATESLKVINTLDHINRILIVTSKFHTRRSYMTFRHIFRDQPYDLFIMGSDDGINYETWYKDYEMSNIILVEWCKFILYMFRCYIF